MSIKENHAIVVFSTSLLKTTGMVSVVKMLEFWAQWQALLGHFKPQRF